MQARRREQVARDEGVERQHHRPPEVSVSRCVPMMVRRGKAVLRQASCKVNVRR